MKILLIEDSRFLRGAIDKILSKAGHAVTGVADGREGLFAASTDLPGLILLDMMLPGLDGTAVLKALKKDKSTAHIPVIVLTGLSQKNEGKLMDAGAVAYIEKSTLNLEEHADDFLRSVENALKKSLALSASSSN